MPSWAWKVFGSRIIGNQGQFRSALGVKIRANFYRKITDFHKMKHAGMNDVKTSNLD